jgi:hypothetical protein
MRKIKVGLAALLKAEINLIMREFKPITDDWEDWEDWEDWQDWQDWQVFEAAYEEALHRLRFHVVKTLKRDEKKMDGFGKVSPRMQKARA